MRVPAGEDIAACTINRGIRAQASALAVPCMLGLLSLLSAARLDMLRCSALRQRLAALRQHPACRTCCAVLRCTCCATPAPCCSAPAPSVLHMLRWACDACCAALCMLRYASALLLSTSGAWKSLPSLGLKARNSPHFCSPASTRSSLRRQLATTCGRRGQVEVLDIADRASWPQAAACGATGDADVCSLSEPHM